MKKCQEIEPLKAGEMIEPIVFEPKRNDRLVLRGTKPMLLGN